MYSAAIFECVTPAVPEGAAQTVEMSIDQYSNSKVSFFYFEDPLVESVRPLKGPISGGTRIEIHGWHLDAMHRQNFTRTCQMHHW